MRAQLLRLASELAERGEPFALATVVSREPPISAQVGDMAVITQGGAFHGWVGGSCTRPTVMAEAARALDEGRPRLIALAPAPEVRARPGLTVFPMTCHSGGTVEIYIQPVLPVPRLLVFGTSPTARALARLGKAMGYTVHVVDPHADAADFPEADAVFTAPPPPTRGSSAPLFAAVATQGQWDEDALVAAAAHAPAYLGVVASPKRFAEIRSLLAGRVGAPVLDAVKNPAGLDLGAKGPEEVALSVLAQIVQERSSGRPLREPVPPSAAVEARDPICGMTVAVEGALHRATHEGREYFFCCAGCRERFAAAPDRYAVPVG